MVNVIILLMRSNQTRLNKSKNLLLLYNLIYKSKTSTYCYHWVIVISYARTQSDTISCHLRAFYGRYCSCKLMALLQLQIENDFIKWIQLASLLKSHSLSSSSFWLQVFFVRALVFFFLHFHFFSFKLFWSSSSCTKDVFNAALFLG